jgi:hypothetical protein
MTGISRYDGLPVASATVPDGTGGVRDVRYRRRRQLPQADTVTPLATHVVAALDRLDRVAARYLGDPLAFWRITDANPSLDPDALVGPDAEGAMLVIPVPEA